MKSHIALLRGINVGGHHKAPMSELRELITDTGFLEVKTYIQSGNVIFKSKEKDTEKLQDTIQKAIQNHFGFEVAIQVKTKETLQKIFDDCPFEQIKKEQSYFVILNQIPDEILVKEASQKNYPNEEFHILNNCIYFYAENGYSKAKFSLNYFEKKLQVSATTRNYKTMTRLLVLSSEGKTTL